MAEYIEREVLLHEMKMDIRPPFAVVRDFPPADVTPVVHGKWLDFYNDFSTAECCKCGECFEVSSGREAKKIFLNCLKGFINTAQTVAQKWIWRMKMNQLDYIAENQMLRKEIERLKAFPPVSVRADVLDLALQCAELKAELKKVTEKQQKKCSMCGLFENNAYSLFTLIGSYKRYIFNYCPMCGRKLDGDEQNDRP